MGRRSRWIGAMALACSAAVAAVVSNSARSAEQAQAVPAAVTSGVSFTTTALPEITNLPPARNTPYSIDDLKAIQARVEAVVKHVLPAVVAISIRSNDMVEQGSGVIVSKDGYVLTAGHVSGTPGTKLVIILSNGTAVSGMALGANTQIDSGMIKIDTEHYPADYPYVPMGDSTRLSAGQWVVALGHPGGYQGTRPPVVRIGRVLRTPSNVHGDRSRGNTPYIRTDCELIMGDSGGPLFDLDGRLVGINSRIGEDVSANIHVPIDTYEQSWKLLADSKVSKGDYEGLLGSLKGPSRAQASAQSSHGSLGAIVASDLRITQIFDGGAAEKAHLSAEDVITKVNGKSIKTLEELHDIIAALAPGKSVSLEYRRAGKSSEVSVTLLPAGND